MLYFNKLRICYKIITPNKNIINRGHYIPGYKLKYVTQLLLPPNVQKSGLYIRAGSRQSSPASLQGFAGYFHYFKSQDMVRR